MQALCQLRLHGAVETVITPRGAKKRIDKPRDEWYLVEEPVGWDQHVVSRMWRGHEFHLMRYQTAVCQEWHRRGFRDTCLSKTTMVYAAWSDGFAGAVPDWLGDERLHSAHRSRLLEKAPEHYSQFGWTETPSETYRYWPDV